MEDIDVSAELDEPHYKREIQLLQVAIIYWYLYKEDGIGANRVKFYATASQYFVDHIKHRFENGRDPTWFRNNISAIGAHNKVKPSPKFLDALKRFQQHIAEKIDFNSKGKAIEETCLAIITSKVEVERAKRILEILTIKDFDSLILLQTRDRAMETETDAHLEQFPQKEVKEEDTSTHSKKNAEDINLRGQEAKNKTSEKEAYENENGKNLNKQKEEQPETKRRETQQDQPQKEQLPDAIDQAQKFAEIALTFVESSNYQQAFELFESSNNICSICLTSENSELVVMAEFVIVQNSECMASIYLNLGNYMQAKSICLMILPLAKRNIHTKQLYGKLCHILAEIEFNDGNVKSLKFNEYLNEAKNHLENTSEEQILNRLKLLENRTKIICDRELIILESDVSQFKNVLYGSFPLYWQIEPLLKIKDFLKAHSVINELLAKEAELLMRGFLYEIMASVEIALSAKSEQSRLMAIEQYELAYSTSANVSVKIAALKQLWVIETEMGNLIKGMNALERYYDLAKQQKNDFMISEAAFFIGVQYQNLGRHDKAIEIWEANLTFSEKVSSAIFRLNYFIRLSAATHDKKAFKKSFNYYEAAYRINSEYNLGYFMDHSYQYLEIYKKWGKTPVLPFIVGFKSLIDYLDPKKRKMLSIIRNVKKNGAVN